LLRHCNGFIVYPFPLVAVLTHGPELHNDRPVLSWWKAETLEASSYPNAGTGVLAVHSSGVPAHLAQWSWNCSVHGKPGASASGSGADLDDCKAKFKAAWTAIRAGLGEDDIALAREYAANSREALA
jgi:hypothetical protein